MTYLGNNEAQKGYLHSLGTELRGLRERAGYTCEFVAAALNPEQPSRDRISKLERGISGIDQPVAARRVAGTKKSTGNTVCAKAPRN